METVSATLAVPEFTPEHELWIDLETFYDADYTLKKLSTSDYVRDPRFETIGVGVDDGEEQVWMEDAEFREWAKTVPWERVAVGGHHFQFDGLILAHHYGIYPGFHFCTMSMARTFGIEEGVSLEALGNHFNVGTKGHEVENAKGKRRKDFTAAEWKRYGEYCKLDCSIARGAFGAMVGRGFPEPELYLIDQTVRMFTQPRLVLDEPLLRQYQVEEKKRKDALLARIGADRKAVGQNETLAGMFREFGVEPPLKWSTKQQKDIYAFAKNDPGMQELLEHERDEVRWIAEARIAVKSTTNETRAERFLRSGANGARLPVYLNYWKAHTGRWAGGDKRNFQNLGRVDPKNPTTTGYLKRSLLAPEGEEVVAADSGAIEARGTAWLAGHTSLLEGFRQKRDIYSEMASEIFGRKVDRKREPGHELFHPDDAAAGGLGKVTCFAAGTLVLTPQGWVPIEQVTTNDRVWDGVEWTTHEGVVDQGIQETWEFDSVAATPDHEILTGHGWRAWSEVLTSPSLFQSALSAASLPCSAGSSASARRAGPWGGIRSSGARVDGRGSSLGKTSNGDEQPDAIGVQRSNRTSSGTGSTEKPLPTMLTECGSSTEGRLASVVATIRRTTTTITTAVAGFLSALSGAQTLRHSFASSRPCPGGMFLSSSSIGSTTSGGMSPATSGSPLGRSTWTTVGPSGRCSGAFNGSRRRTRVYDLLSAGSRRRFTILAASSGPLLVHNCLGLGYQMGWPKFAVTLLAGPMGNPPVKLTQKDADTMGVNVGKFQADDWKMRRMKKLITRLPESEFLVHCAAADAIVRTYRTIHKPIVDLWGEMETVIEAMEAAQPGEEFAFGPGECLTVVRHGIRLPNGLTLHYPGLRKSEDTLDEDGEVVRGGYSYLEPFGKQRQHLYGGLMTENLVQALARIIIGEQMLSIEAKYGYQITLSTHDEIATVVPASEAALAEHRLVEEMKIAPGWADGWPLNAEGGHARSYGEC